jgi:hypothetical protein
MRRNSFNQTKASRGNGAKSKGPNSKAGKRKSAKNALKDGVFSRGVVIENLGEKQEEFDKVKKLFWNFFRPSNSLEDVLVSDFVENWWRRERVRRAEELELQNRLELDQLKHDLSRSDEVERLRLRFAVLFREYSIGAKFKAAHEIPPELQQVRQDLASTAVGIDFLLLLLKLIAPSPEDAGILSPRRKALLNVISGFGHEGTCASLVLDSVGEISRERAAKAWASKNQIQSQRPPASEAEKKNQGEAIRSARELPPELISRHIEMIIDQLNERKRHLQIMQESEWPNRMATAMVDARISERFWRAETQAERRMYRALWALGAMRSHSPSDLPPAKPKLRAEPEQPKSGSEET